MYEHYKPSIFTIIWEMCRVILQILRAHLPHFSAESVVIVMDPIDAYSDLYNVSHIESINKLIRAARKKDIPVFATRWMRIKNKNPVDAIDIKGHWTFYVPEHQTSIMTSVDPPDKIVKVTHTNAFVHEDFRQLVKDKKHLIIAGAWLEYCIINTTRCALDNNMSVSVVKNASTGHFPFRWITLIDIQSVYGQIVKI